jgi:chromosome segregation ATPase
MTRIEKESSVDVEKRKRLQAEERVRQLRHDRDVAVETIATLRGSVRELEERLAVKRNKKEIDNNNTNNNIQAEEKKAWLVEKNALIEEKNALSEEKKALIEENKRAVHSLNEERDVWLMEKNALSEEKKRAIHSLNEERDVWLLEKGVLVEENDALLEEKDAMMEEMRKIESVLTTRKALPLETPLSPTIRVVESVDAVDMRYYCDLSKAQEEELKRLFGDLSVVEGLLSDLSMTLDMMAERKKEEGCSDDLLVICKAICSQMNDALERNTTISSTKKI